MQVFTKIATLQEALRMVSSTDNIGFVPTMGALHAGHLSLVKKAREMTGKVVVSIFVNPTQFDKKEDLEHYPVTIQEDLSKLQNSGCDFVFIPGVDEMYPETLSANHFDFEGLDQVMEGAHRKGHFDGVGTIVKRLFEIVQPQYAFFGEKDFQQLQIIKKMVAQTRLPIQIIGVPIYREADGLAMSSRNTRLSKKHRGAAPFIYKTLVEAKNIFGTKNAEATVAWVTKRFEEHPLLELEYYSISDEKSLLPIAGNQTCKPHKRYRAFVAVYAGNIRLIDNMAMC